MFRPRLRPMPDPVGGPTGNAGSSYIRKDIRYDKSTENPGGGAVPVAGGEGTASYTIDGKKIEIKFSDFDQNKKFEKSDLISEMKVDGQVLSKEEIGAYTQAKIINRNNCDVLLDRAEVLQDAVNTLGDLWNKTQSEEMDINKVVTLTAGPSDGAVKSGIQTYQIKDTGVECTVTTNGSGHEAKKMITSIQKGGKTYAVSPPIQYKSPSTILEVAEATLKNELKNIDEKVKDLDEEYKRLDSK